MASAPLFENHFWSQGLKGLKPLFEQLESGSQSLKEIVDWNASRASVEQEQAKRLQKHLHDHPLKKEQGGVKVALDKVNSLSETLASAHHQLSLKIHEDVDAPLNRIKDALRTAKKQYEAEAVKGMKALEKEQVICDKAQKEYYSKSVEMLKAQDIVAKGMQDDMTKKYFEKLGDKATKAQLDAEKAEKAYRESVERLNTASARWEELNVRLCREIQRFEEERIAVTKKSLRNSLEHQIQICAQTTNKLYEQMLASVDAISVEDDLNFFISTKRTGSEPPARATFTVYGGSREKAGIRQAASQSQLNTSRSSSPVAERGVSMFIPATSSSRPESIATNLPVEVASPVVEQPPASTSAQSSPTKKAMGFNYLTGAVSVQPSSDRDSVVSAHDGGLAEVKAAVAADENSEQTSTLTKRSRSPSNSQGTPLPGAIAMPAFGKVDLRKTGRPVSEALSVNSSNAPASAGTPLAVTKEVNGSQTALSGSASNLAAQPPRLVSPKPAIASDATPVATPTATEESAPVYAQKVAPIEKAPSADALKVEDLERRDSVAQSLHTEEPKQEEEVQAEAEENAEEEQTSDETPREFARKTIKMEGWINVCEESTKEWTRRWAALEGGYLWFFDDPSDNTKPQGSNKPRGMQSVQRLVVKEGVVDVPWAVPEGHENALTLLANGGKKVLLISSEKSADAKAWADQISSMASKTRR